MRPRLPSAQHAPLSALRMLALALLAVVFLAVLWQHSSPRRDDDDDDAWIHKHPGLVVQGSSVWLTQEPKDSVQVSSHCEPGVFIEITRESWETPHSLMFGKCEVVVCKSADKQYDGLHVRIREPDEKIGEWVPEEVFEAEEGPGKALTPLERSRSAFDFLAAAEFACVKQAQRLSCVLPNTSVPMYVVDPRGGLDDDGWNGFPVMLVVGSGQREWRALPAVQAAMHMAEHWRPRRGRLVVVPALNVAHLLDASEPAASLDADFVEGGAPASSNLAKGLWRLCAVLRPDVFFLLGEAAGTGRITSTFEAVPLSEQMAKEAGEKMVLADAPLVQGGLALRLRTGFKTRGIQLDLPSQEASLPVRATTFLRMVSSALVAARVVTPDFAWNVPKLGDCVRLRDKCVSV